MNLDQMCADAMKRLTMYINRSASQHLYMLRGKVRK